MDGLVAEEMTDLAPNEGLLDEEEVEEVQEGVGDDE